MPLVVAVPLLVARMASATCESVLPPNVDAGMLQSTVIGLLQRSPTFQQQCRRIAASRFLRVTLHVGTTVDVGASAQTIITRYDGGGIRAAVTLRFAEDYLLLLAHEFEHILEQVEGVDLRDEAASGRAWRMASGAWETRRAFKAGIRVRKEVDALPRRPFD
jgi:hypothetical protein